MELSEDASTTDDGLIPALVYDPAEDGIMRAYVSTGSFLLNRHFPYRYFLCPMREVVSPHQYYMTSASAIAYASPRSMFHCNLFGVYTVGNTVSCSIHECINAAGIMSSSWHLISDVPSTKTIETSMLFLSLTR